MLPRKATSFKEICPLIGEYFDDMKLGALHERVRRLRIQSLAYVGSFPYPRVPFVLPPSDQEPAQNVVYRLDSKDPFYFSYPHPKPEKN